MAKFCRLLPKFCVFRQNPPVCQSLIIYMLYLQAQRERAVGAAAADGGAAAAGRRDQQLPAPAGAGRRAADQAQDHEGQQGDHEEEAGAGHLHREYSTVQYSTVQCSAVQYSTVQYSTVQYVQYSAVQYWSHLSCTCTLLHQMLGWGSPEAWQISRTDSPWLACTFWPGAITKLGTDPMMVLVLTLGWLGDGGGLQHEQGVGHLQGSSSPLHPAAVVTWQYCQQGYNYQHICHLKL